MSDMKTMSYIPSIYTIALDLGSMYTCNAGGACYCCDTRWGWGVCVCVGVGGGVLLILNLYRPFL